jgi:hypothetical protein
MKRVNPDMTLGRLVDTILPKEAAMTDTTTNKRLSLAGNKEVGFYLMVPLQQLVEVRKLLDEHEINYWVEENAISINGRPAIAFVIFGLKTEKETVEQILDSVA